ncbi:hypothetical protein GCM10009677_33120 [Sphaerisporangium rubeum]|uniref:Spore-associated protein A n=1 Tax=Sphaerisporangium rubeum TaxID=321317 RepID=A0A7X0IGP9_9ACTN|nr:hypothetical protein [Sphaerisporangium rubeum]MBB6474841.1 hypothetical protein [Sphaerisporangium rubeum]
MRTFRNLVTSLLVSAAACATLTVATPASASASADICTNNGPYSFKRSYETTYATIYAYSGSNCVGSYLSYGRTTLSGSNVVIYAYDAKCDNIGLKTYTSGGQSVTSTGCYNNPNKTVSRSSSGNYFWVEVNGYLSATASIPI